MLEFVGEYRGCNDFKLLDTTAELGSKKVNKCCSIHKLCKFVKWIIIFLYFTKKTINAFLIIMYVFITHTFTIRPTLAVIFFDASSYIPYERNFFPIKNA